MRDLGANGNAVLSVVYPAAEPYFTEFLNSLSKQTDQDFTLFLINDGVTKLDQYLSTIDFNVEVLTKTGTPAALRKEGIQWVLSKGIKNIFFADTDDYFADNRIEVLKRMLVNYDIVCNELILVGEGISQPMAMLEKFLKDQMEIHKEQVRLSNCMGLSNTAAHAEIIARYFKSVPDTIVAFDWALFALCVYGGARTVFTNETRTYYRQHHHNTASPHCFSDEQIVRGVAIKRDQYQLCAQFHKEYVPWANSFSQLAIQLGDDQGLKQKYCQAVRQQASEGVLWWAPIKSLEELGL